MGQPEDDLIIRMLRDLHFRAGIDHTIIEQIYKEDQAILASQTATEAEKKAAQSRQEALAKSLPAIASGLRDAIKGFQSGDPLGGSAAVMDICTSVTSLIGSLAAVPGPTALIGALFSIISMILKSFAPQQESLSQQLENVIRALDAEKQIAALKMAHQGLRVSTAMMMAGGRKWSFADLLIMMNISEGDTIQKLREGAAWLTEAKNQDQELWGQILAAQCQGYSYFLQAWTYATAKLDVSVDDLKSLMAGVKVCNGDQLTFLRRVRTIAGNRGRIWAIGGFDKIGSYPESAGLHVRDAAKGKGKYLGGKQRAIAVSRVKVEDEHASDPHPYLAVFALQQANDRILPTFESRYRMNNKTYGIFGRWPLAKYDGWIEIKKLKGMHDIAATPGEKKGEVYIYTVNGKTVDRWVHTGKLSKTEGLELKHSDELKFEVFDNFSPMAICAVSGLRSGPGEDRTVLSDEKWVAYAGLRASGVFIRVYFSGGGGGLFSAPRDGMLGMKVDSTYLWVFGGKFIACVSHTALKVFSEEMKTSRANITQLHWAFYDIPAELGGDWQSGGNYDGLRDLAPCDDGTLTASFYDRIAGGSVGPRDLKIRQARPVIDRAKNAIIISGTQTDNLSNTTVTHGWELSTNSWIKPSRLYREPIFCWQLTEGLIESLSKEQLALAARA